MDNEDEKSKVEEIFNSWIADIISSAFGIALITYGSTANILLSGKLICIIFGGILQIPLVYFKIYQAIFGD